MKRGMRDELSHRTEISNGAMTPSHLLHFIECARHEEITMYMSW